jgi:hypothetical protein
MKVTVKNLIKLCILEVVNEVLDETSFTKYFPLETKNSDCTCISFTSTTCDFNGKDMEQSNEFTSKEIYSWNFPVTT